MKKDVISFTADDLKRIRKLVDSGEHGFPVLAVHSLVEREIAAAAGYRYPDSAKMKFFDLCHMLPDMDYLHWKAVENLNRDRNEYANRVRHNFEDLTPADAGLIENRFLDFVRLFSPASERLPEYGELKKAVTNALNDIKTITISEEKYRELLGKYREVIAIKSDYDEVNRKYEDEKAKVDGLNKQILDLNEKFSSKKRKLESDYAAKRTELYNAQRDRSRLEKDLKALAEERDTAIKELESRLVSEVGRLEEERKGFIAELEKSRHIVDAYDFESRFFAYSEGRRNFMKSSLVLSPRQREIVDSVSLSSDCLVCGGAGSGKTLVLLAILKKLTEESPAGEKTRCRFLTFTKTLASFSKNILPELDDSVVPEIRRVNQLVYTMMVKIFGRQRFSWGDDPLKKRVPALERNPGYAKEIRLFIWPNNIAKDAYLSGCERRGMKDDIALCERAEIWRALEELESDLEKDPDEWPLEYAVVRLLGEYETAPGRFDEFLCDYTLVDEYQDLSLATLRLLKKLTGKAVYLAGDPSQSIFKRTDYSLTETGIEVGGRVRKLDQCYRSTREISDVCRRYMETTGISGVPGTDDEDMRNIRSGLPVSFITSDSADECRTGLVEDILALLRIGIPGKDICVVVYSKKQRNPILEALKAEAVDAEIIDPERTPDDDDMFESDSVKILTIHSAKGLEFPCVVFYAVEDVHESDVDSESYENLKRSLVYVAITRACSSLHVFYDGSTRSDALETLGRIVSRDDGEDCPEEKM